jgi:hypothetical protein
MPRIVISFIIVVVCVVGLPAAALQTQPRDYVIECAAEGDVSDDGAEVILHCTVRNQGGDAADETIIRLIGAGDQQSQPNLSSATLPALKSGEQVQIDLSFPIDIYEPESRQPFDIQVISSGIVITSRSIVVQIPAESMGGLIAISPSIFEIPPLGIRVDLTDPVQVVMLVGFGGAALVLLLITLIILRLLFRRPPSFGTWQPPYANVPPMNPDTMAGRRQSWQQHAQNNALPPRCTPGAIQARKLLLGMDGKNMSGWRVIALRMSQYDMYGRVARSQILASKGVVKRLDRLAHKAQSLEHERMLKQVRPVAKKLANEFKKKVNSRNAMLPVALDLRFQGAHGDVRIVFELYQCQNEQWQRIDNWEPEMTVLSKTIYDSYTYTIYGQSGGETLKEYRQRLYEDLAWILAALVGSRASDAPAPDTVTNAPPVQSGM